FIPYPVIQMCLVGAVIVLLVMIFYKELVASSFDPVMAASLGMPVKAIHYTLMAALAVVVVSAFSAVGAILVIAMLILPGITAALYSDRLTVLLFASLPLAAVYAIGGLHLALWLGCSIAGAMVVVAFTVFLLSWIFSPHRGLLIRFLRRRRLRVQSPEISEAHSFQKGISEDAPIFRTD
ncbi:MAG: metal ABC transporter permease, partial [Verrucomicrobiota bacterium]